jgi:predicted AlkP superfamily pyrophosphatase or phosphodiesterase
MYPTVVLDVVGLTADLLDAAPNLKALAARGGVRPLATVFPAVTCSVQSTFATGLRPRDHGIVGNGWYFHDLSEVWFWRQSNRLVGGEKIWEAAKRRDPAFTCANMFWWYNMYSSVEASVTPRPMYPADGRKIPDVYTEPSELRDELQAKLGTFPLFQFWGPFADLVSSRWIVDATLHVWETRRPTLLLVYLPHLDYDLQRFGPDDARVRKAVADVDGLCHEIIQRTERDGARVLVVSEYGVTNVSGAVHPNRALREAGFVRFRDEMGHEVLDPGASEAFAVSDHQIAHVYVKRPERVPEVKRLLEGLPGVEAVLDDEGKRAHAVDHPRAGTLVAVSRADRWFTYYYWLDDARAPDYARCVDIHRKPGYDPAELFLDPALMVPQAKIGLRFVQMKLGMRTLMDVIGLDASVVKGSHGRLTERAEAGPLVIGSAAELLPAGPIAATDVKALVLRHVFGSSGAGDVPLDRAG